MILSSKASVTKLPDSQQVEATMRGHKLLFDKEPSEGGKGEGPGPGETMLAALGACQTYTAYLLAEKMRIELEGFSVDIEGYVDEGAAKGQKGAPKGLLEVRYTMHFKTSAPQDKVEKLASLVEEHCPVENSFRNSIHMVRSGLTIE